MSRKILQIAKVCHISNFKGDMKKHIKRNRLQVFVWKRKNKKIINIYFQQHVDNQLIFVFVKKNIRRYISSQKITIYTHYTKVK